MRILILGVTGLLGQAMRRAALKRGHEVEGGARRNGDFTVDVTDLTGLAEALERRQFDLLVNCAALVDIAECEHDPGLAYAVNARPVADLARVCQERNVRFVQISTDHYYIDGERRAHNETEPVTLVNDYARTKFAGESFALATSDALVVRTSIVGVRGWGKPTLAEWAMQVVRNDEPATLFTDAYTSSLDVDNLAAAVLDLVAHNGRGLYNIAASEVYSKAEFVLALAAAMQRHPRNLRPGAIRQRHRARCLGLDPSKAESVLGRSMPDLDTVVNSVLRKWSDK